MTVNPDELLIFKMRGLKSGQEKTTEEQAQQKPAAAPVQPPQQPRVEAVREKQPFFAQKPAPARAEEKKPAPVAQPKPKEQKQKTPLFTFGRKSVKPKAITEEEGSPEHASALPEWAAPPPESEEDERRMRELETLEQKVSLYENPPGGLEAEELESRGRGEKTETNVFSTLTGVLFVVNALVFSYFIFPQSSFVLGYIAKNGLGALLLNWSYAYGTSFINSVLAVLSALSGIMMLANVKRSHMLSGLVGSGMLIAVSFEYLNSSALYLLVVTVIAFISVVALAYARMSAVNVIEREAPIPQEVNWPRIETF